MFFLIVLLSLFLQLTESHVNKSTVDVLNSLKLGYKIDSRGRTELKVCKHTHTHTHARTHARTHTHTHTHTHTRMHAHTHTCFFSSGTFMTVYAQLWSKQII